MKKNNLQSAKLAIELITDAENEIDVLNAVAIAEEVDWNKLGKNESLLDDWHEGFGDAKKYLP